MELEEFVDKLWLTYPSDLCHKKKGTKVNAMKAAKKLKPEQYDKILLDIEALKKYDRKEPKPDRWPHVSTFLNSGYYGREIGSTTEQRERVAQKECQWDNCSFPVHGSQFKYCTDHQYESTDPFKPRRKKVMVKLGLVPEKGETRKQWADKCRQYLKNTGLSISGSVKKTSGTD